MIYEILDFGVFELEVIYVICEVVVELGCGVFLFFGGKDLVVLLCLVCKVFYFGVFLFLVMYVDIGYNFFEVIEYCDCMVVEVGVELIVVSV